MMKLYDEGFTNFVNERWSINEFDKTLINRDPRDTSGNIIVEKGIAHQRQQGQTISKVFQSATTMVSATEKGMSTTGDLIGVDIDVQGSPKEIRGITFDKDTKKLELSIEGKYFPGETLYQSVKEDVDGNPIETAKIYLEVGEKGSGVYQVAKTQPRYGIETKKYDLNNPTDFAKLYNDLGLAGSKAQGVVGANFGTAGLTRAEEEFITDNYVDILDGKITGEGKDATFTPTNKAWWEQIQKKQELTKRLREIIKIRKLTGDKWNWINTELSKIEAKNNW